MTDYSYEIVGFYPSHLSTHKVIKGTVHLYLTALDIDIRGIQVQAEKKKIFVRFPHAKGYDYDEKKLVPFPTFDLSDRVKSKEILFALRKDIEALLHKEIWPNWHEQLAKLKANAPPPKPGFKGIKKPFVKKPVQNKPGNKRTNFASFKSYAPRARDDGNKVVAFRKKDKA